MLSSDVSQFKKSIFSGVISRLVVKILNLILNIFYLRRIPSNLLGISNVRLGLLHNSLVGLVRDPFRKSLVTERFSQDLFKLSFYCPLIGFIFSIIFSLIWIFILSTPIESFGFKDYTCAVFLFALSALFEISCEPFYIFLKTLDYNNTIHFIDTLSQLTHTVVLICLLFFRNYINIYHVCFLHFSRFFILLVSYIFGVWIFYRKRVSLSNKSLSDKPDLIRSYFVQNCLQVILSHGENYITNLLPWLSFTHLGHYSLVFNLGSMIPNVIFAPIEESLYVLCGRRSIETIENKRNFFRNNFQPIQRLMMFLGLFSMIYGHILGGPFLTFFFSKTHSIEILTKIMTLFSTYLIFLSVNGPLEAFVYATFDARAVNSSSGTLMKISSVHFISLAIITYFNGVYGILLTNMFVYCLRIYLR